MATVLRASMLAGLMIASIGAPARAQTCVDTEAFAEACLENASELTERARASCRSVLQSCETQSRRVLSMQASLMGQRAINLLLHIELRTAQRDGLHTALDTARCLVSLDSTYQSELEAAEDSLERNAAQLRSFAGQYRGRLATVQELVSEYQLLSCDEISQAAFSSLVEGSDRQAAARVVERFNAHCRGESRVREDFRDLVSEPRPVSQDPCASSQN